MDLGYDSVRVYLWYITIITIRTPLY